MNFNKLTVKAQEAIAEAQNFARGAGNPELAPEHVLLALLRQEPARIAREVVAILDRRDADPGRSPISVHPVDLVVRGTVRGLACPSTTT